MLSQLFGRRRPWSAAIFPLIAAEFWERFSFFSLYSLLVLFLSAPTSKGGFGWTEPESLRFFGECSGLIYLAPLLGGIVSDRWLGPKAAMWLGMTFMLIGNLLMGALHAINRLVELFSPAPVRDFLFGSETEFGRSGAYLSARLANSHALLQDGLSIASSVKTPYFTTSFCFYGALFLLIAGTGLFKPSMAIVVGNACDANHQSPDKGYTLFYMAVNLGSLLGIFVSGYLGERIGWHYGFLCAAMGMVIGLFVLSRFSVKYVPRPRTRHDADTNGASKHVARDRRAILFIALMIGFALLFWTAYGQSGSLLPLLVRKHTDRVILGHSIPVTWFLTMNPITVVLLAPVFAKLWGSFDPQRSASSIPIKFAIGLLFLTVGIFCLSAAQIEGSLRQDALNSAYWIILFYFFMSIGELLISPIGLSMIATVAPKEFQGALMGAWFVGVALAVWLSGELGSIAIDSDLLQYFSIAGTAVFVCALILLSFRKGLSSLIEEK